MAKATKKERAKKYEQKLAVKDKFKDVFKVIKKSKEEKGHPIKKEK